MANIIYVCKSLDKNRKIEISTSTGSYVTQISESHQSAYIQGEEVLITRPDGRTLIYSVRGSYKRLI